MAEAPWRQAAAPPPPGAVGHTPSTRLKSEIPGREPPLVVQNAMLTKDKKPFTYTPGGLDLSEIRSPRMARRLELNAMNEGVAPLPQAQPHQHSGPLPPSALAAMQPQLPVQVFPSGGIPQPHHHGGGGGGPPPPPPPPKAPPMKSTSPVPLDAFERPDMTKIIPENPMALLRKTAGPVIKRDPIFNKDNYNSSAVAPAPPVRQPESPQKASPAAAVGSIYVPPVNQNASPSTPPNRQPQSPQFTNQRDSPPAAARVPPAYYKRQPSSPPQPEPQSPQFVPQKQPPQREPQSPESPKVSLSKAPTPWLQKRPQQPDTPEWAVNDQKALSPPPLAQEQPQQQVKQPQQQAAPWRQQHQPEPQPWQQRQQQPEPQPWQQRQQPQQPETLPWQQRQQQQPETQPWQQRQQPQPEPQVWQQKQQQQQQPEPQPWQQRQQQQQQQTPPWQQQQDSPPIQKKGGVRKQVQVRENAQESGPTERTEVVIVNEPPQVFQHPGPTQRIIIRAQPQQQQNNSGASSNGHAQPQTYVHKFSSPGATPPTPGSNSDARSLNRQLSWNSNPTQSNTFRVLQKITNTDGDDDEDQPITEHSPKMPQHFPQRQASIEQARRLRQNEGDQELMNKFKQEFNLNDFLEYPRYRGGHIPSKLFWMLDDSVPQGQPNNTSGPKVRTIPIQIEGNGPPKTYIPPSEQTVPEPKKYMGSSIPSRSFKILQAMTGPDDCGPGQSDY